MSEGRRRIADIGIDLAAGRHPDAHRLEVGVADVRGDDHPSASHLVADRFGGQPLALGHVVHLLCDDSAARIVNLRPHRVSKALGHPFRSHSVSFFTPSLASSRHYYVIGARTRLGLAIPGRRSAGIERLVHQRRWLTTNSCRKILCTRFPAVASCLAAAAILSAIPPGPPPLSLRDVAGEPRVVSNHTGQPVILNLRATWCVPCREEMPMLARLLDRHAEEGVVFIRASTGDTSTRNRIEPFLEERRILFRIRTRATAQATERFGLLTALPRNCCPRPRGAHRSPVAGTPEATAARAPARTPPCGFLRSGPERFPSTLPELPASHEGDGNDHEDVEDCAYGGVGLEGASLVPS